MKLFSQNPFRRFRVQVTAAAAVVVSGVSFHGEFRQTGFPRTASFAQEDAIASAATVEDAIRLLDLRDLQLPAGAEPHTVQAGMLSYQVKSSPKTAWDLHRQQLAKLGWKELPGTNAAEASVSGLFGQKDFIVSLSTSSGGTPDTPMNCYVSLVNYGNVRLSTLPVIKDATSTFSNESTAMYVTDLKVPDAAKESRRLLLEQGWEPYGENPLSDEQSFFNVKRNAVEVSAMVSVAPAQNHRTSISFSARLLSADLPAPDFAEMLGFDDSQKILRFDTGRELQDIAKYYQQVLPPKGWKPTTKELVKATGDFNRPTGSQVYRNAAHDLISIDLERIQDKSSATIRHMTAKEVAEADDRAKKAAQKEIARRKESEEQLTAAREQAAADFRKRSAEFDVLRDAAINEALGLPGTGLNGGSARKKLTAEATDGSDSDDKESTGVAIPLPGEVKKVNRTSNNVLQLKAGKGQGKATAEFIVNTLQAAGWKTDTKSEPGKTSGNVQLASDNRRISLTYVDTGLSDVTITVIGIGTDLTTMATTDNQSGKSPVPGTTIPLASKRRR